MATRFYLPSGGTSPLASLAIDAGWEGSVSTFFRAPTKTSKTDSALTDKAARFLSTATRDDCWAQFVSLPLAGAHSFTTSETLSWVLRGLEGNIACDAYPNLCVRVVSNDGGTVRGVLYGPTSTGVEYDTSAKTRSKASAALQAAVSAQAGDRIVIEIGCRGSSPSTGYDVTQRYGDPSATSDFACSDNLTTDLCPWVELSPTLTFAGSTVDDDLAGSHRILVWSSDDLAGSHRLCGVDDLTGSHRVLAWASDDLGGSHRVLAWSTDDLAGSHAIHGMVSDDLAGSHRVLAWADVDLAGSHRVLSWSSDDLVGSHRVLALSDDDLAGSHRIVGVDDLAGSHRVLAWSDDDLAGSHRVLVWVNDDLDGSHKLILWADDDLAGSHRIRTRITSSRVLVWRILDDVAVTATTYPAGTHTLIGHITLTVGGVDFTEWAEGMRVTSELPGGFKSLTFRARGSGLPESIAAGSVVRLSMSGAVLFEGRLASTANFDIGEQQWYSVEAEGNAAKLRDRGDYYGIYIDTDTSQWVAHVASA